MKKAKKVSWSRRKLLSYQDWKLSGLTLDFTQIKVTLFFGQTHKQTSKHNKQTNKQTNKQANKPNLIALNSKVLDSI